MRKTQQSAMIASHTRTFHGCQSHVTISAAHPRQWHQTITWTVPVQQGLVYADCILGVLGDIAAVKLGAVAPLGAVQQ